jgi:hypothetical protein
VGTPMAAKSSFFCAAILVKLPNTWLSGGDRSLLPAMHVD